MDAAPNVWEDYLNEDIRMLLFSAAMLDTASAILLAMTSKANCARFAATARPATVTTKTCLGADSIPMPALSPVALLAYGHGHLVSDARLRAVPPDFILTFPCALEWQKRTGIATFEKHRFAIIERGSAEVLALVMAPLPDIGDMALGLFNIFVLSALLYDNAPTFSYLYSRFSRLPTIETKESALFRGAFRCVSEVIDPIVPEWPEHIMTYLVQYPQIDFFRLAKAQGATFTEEHMAGACCRGGPAEIEFLHQTCGLPLTDILLVLVMEMNKHAMLPLFATYAPWLFTRAMLHASIDAWTLHATAFMITHKAIAPRILVHALPPSLAEMARAVLVYPKSCTRLVFLGSVTKVIQGDPFLEAFREAIVAHFQCQ